jgi:hypothetical protein
MEWCLASGTLTFRVHLGDQTWWMEHMWVGMILKPSTFGAKWVKTYATHSAIICEALWDWPQELTISFILMGKMFGVVLPIHIHIMDLIYA